MPSFTNIGLWTTVDGDGKIRSVRIEIPGPCSASTVRISADIDWAEVAMLQRELTRALEQRHANARVDADVMPFNHEERAMGLEAMLDEAVGLIKLVAEGKAGTVGASEWLRRNHADVWYRLDFSE